MKVDEVKDALRKRQGQMGEKCFAIRATRLSERAHLVLTLLLADCTEQDICEAILNDKKPDATRREPYEIRAAEQEVNILFGEIAHVFGLFVYQHGL